MMPFFMSRPLQQILKEYFGYDEFRPLQLDVMQAVMSGNDVLALMPTGGGKSLCYQVPAMAKDGICLVISPLIALMNDQVQNLRKKNITAFAIHAGMGRKDVISVLEAASHSNCRFLYVSPERLETALFKEYLPGLGISLIAVDEAHCISQWGYDFRPPYLRIVQLRNELPGVPVIALTASATPLVQKDICDKLSIPLLENKTDSDNPFTVFQQSFERANLSYSIFNDDAKINKIVSILQSVQGAAIVYCKSRKRTKEISELLNLQHISADYYNAGLTTDERTTRQLNWIKNKTRVIVCTNAFGMGIDKPDVRTVIHADVPDCLENYYQEAGRAGRDGKKAFAVLLYNKKETEALKTLPGVRFPEIDTIKTIYKSVVNYLQLPEGEAPGTYYDFDLKDFIKKFGLDVQTTIYSLKALEQDGWLSFNEQVFLSATVKFMVYKEALYNYEKNYVAYEPLIKTLLRTYEGIYDYPVSISENFIAYLLRYDVSMVKEQLQKLSFDGIINYQPQKDTPQLMLNRMRIKSSLLTINNEQYAERKKIFTERVDKILHYIQEQKICRSKYIGQYFGDTTINDCGVCDNCLNRKKSALDKTTFDKITALLQNNLQQAQPADVILQNIKGVHKEHVWTVINFLVEEGKLTLMKDGRIEWKD